MTLKKEQIDFINHCRQLIGLVIVSVDYAEIIYNKANPTPYYPTRFKNLHSVDFSIIFKTQDKKEIEIYWDGDFYQYGIGLKINKQSDFLEVQRWNVTDDEIWRGTIGQKITDVELNWETVTETDQSGNKKTFTYPQGISLTFQNNKKIFISAAGFINQEDNEVFGMLNNLTVTNDEELARKVKMIS